uniref:Uncharacterized protein n=1 Tax=Opuntia streptacantha TaxID=393608 RepID=A0A7C9D5R0_OPUST
MAPSTLAITGCIPSLQRQPFFAQHSAPLPEWHLMGFQHSRVSLQTPRRHAFRLLADPNNFSGYRRSSKEVIMVDPLEAKRLAAKEMEEIKAKEKFEREREIEAVNGAWAMLGLTAGLVVEGQTGKGILGQLAGYLGSIVGLFVR